MQYTNPRFEAYGTSYQNQPTNVERSPSYGSGSQQPVHPAFESRSPVHLGIQQRGVETGGPSPMTPETLHPGFQQAWSPPAYAAGFETPATPQTAMPQGTPPSTWWGTPAVGPTSYTPWARGTPQTIQPGMTGQQNLQTPWTFESASPAVGATGPTNQPGQQTPNVRQPAVDLFDEGENLVFEIELPGVTKDDVELVCNDNSLSLKAASSEVHDEENILRSERGEVAYQRYLPLDVSIVPGEIEATFKDGILTVTAPKKEPTSGLHKVDIE